MDLILRWTDGGQQTWLPRLWRVGHCATVSWGALQFSANWRPSERPEGLKLTRAWRNLYGENQH